MHDSAKLGHTKKYICCYLFGQIGGKGLNFDEMIENKLNSQKTAIVYYKCVIIYQTYHNIINISKNYMIYKVLINKSLYYIIIIIVLIILMLLYSRTILLLYYS